MRKSSNVAIVGVGEEIPPLSATSDPVELHVKAAMAAIKDAGLSLKDIDGFMDSQRVDSTNPLYPVTGSSYIAEYMGILPCYHRTLAYGGVGSLSLVTEAAQAIEYGLASTILVVAGDNVHSGLGRDRMVTIYASGAQADYERPYGPSVATLCGLAATRHMKLYGTTSEQLAAVAVTVRKHASMNPKALMRTPITIQDVLNSPMISTPFHLLDCCIVSDGAAAAVITSADRARHCRKQPVYLLGIGEKLTQQNICQAPDLLTLGCEYAGARAFRAAGVKQNDIDLAYLYDPFTIQPILQLESLGFCKRGEGGAFVEGGQRIEIGGELPLNTHGGIHSCVNPGIPAQFFFVTEAVTQLRGEADGRQVRGAELALLSGMGGFQSQYTVLILGKER